MKPKVNYLKSAVLLVIFISIITGGTVVLYDRSLPKGEKLLTLPQKASYAAPDETPHVAAVDVISRTTGDLAGYLGNTPVYSIHDPGPVGSVENQTSSVTLYDIAEKSLAPIKKSSLKLQEFKEVSPDKSKILFLEYADDVETFLKGGIDKRVYVYDYDTGKAVEIVNFNVKDNIVISGFGWSPDSKNIIYCVEKPNEKGFTFFVYNLDNMNTVKYTLSENNQGYSKIINPQISNDGRYMYFVGSYLEHLDLTNGYSKLYRIDLLSEKKAAELLAEDCLQYRLSGDGSRIVFCDFNNNSARKGVFLYNTITKKEKKILDQTSLFDITADGSKIIYYVWNAGATDIRAANLNGEGLDNITLLYRLIPGKLVMGLYWNNDGTRFAASTYSQEGKRIIDITDYIMVVKA